jgi:predicted dehydrogenase
MARHVTVEYGPLISFVEVFIVTPKAIRVGIVGANAPGGAACWQGGLLRGASRTHPLGRTFAETEEMARAAGSLHTAIGLQGRLNPAVRRAAQLVSSGKIGRPLNARIVSTTIGFGPEMPSSHDYFNKASFGANLLTVSVGHTLDLVEAVLGSIVEVDARMEILWSTVKLTDIGEESSRETADHIDVLGKTRSGAVVTADINAGVAPQAVHSSFEIRGSEGWLSLPAVAVLE